MFLVPAAPWNHIFLCIAREGPLTLSVRVKIVPAVFDAVQEVTTWKKHQYLIVLGFEPGRRALWIRDDLLAHALAREIVSNRSEDATTLRLAKPRQL